MSDTREQIIESIRKALSKVPDDEKPADVAVPRNYRKKGERSKKEITDLLAERTSEYKATVQKVRTSDLAATVVDSCRREKVEKLVVPDKFPGKWLPKEITLLHDKPEKPLSYQQLDESDGVITTAALAVAQTGTIILDAGPGQGRRVLTLLPDYHLCIVKAEQIVEVVPEGFARFTAAVKKEGHPITLISGPSATSDIELSRVEGVHGPRKLEVLIVKK